MNYIDNLLNRITMYRLVLYYLLALIAVAIVFGAFGILPYSPLAIIASTLILTVACWLTNQIFAKIFHATVNTESAYITALILALIIPPTLTISGFWFLIAASAFAMASKYILAINRKHIFNPAAFGVALTAFAFGQYASWWVGGNLPLLGFVLVGGLLVVRKIQRFDLVLTFVIVATATIVLINSSFNSISVAEAAMVHTCLFFFGFVMLSEPLTTPPTRPLRIAYGALVGILFAPGIHIGSFYSTPELALLVGNIFSFAVSPKGKYILTLTSKKEIADNTYDFAFATGGKKIKFRPGQYMEWTLAQPYFGREKDIAGWDARGNRRYFTIASAPSEPEIHLGVKFPGGAAGGISSSFKKKMLALQPGDRIMTGSLAGDFTLPRDTSARVSTTKKFVFIAGGIGITPFRSMIKELSGQPSNRDIVLLYSNRNASEIAYREIFDEAERAKTINLKTIYVNTDSDGRIDDAFIARAIPDYRERTFYLSGPRAMVVTFEKALGDLGVPRTQIKTDFFPGFV
jgi:ferredoxin-NADP reductase/Na+-translocating ferredoxin:NAD+ oxidoreductase RnfD subunit